MNNNINQLCFNDMIETIIPKARVTRCRNSNIDVTLLANGGDICITDGTSKSYFCQVPHDIIVDGDRQELHGNMRNRIAKDFIKEYTTEKIYSLEQEYINQEITAKELFEVEKVEMQKIMESQIAPLFPAEYVSYLELNEWGPRQVLISFCCKYANPMNHWKSYRNKIEIYFDNHNLNAFQTLTNNKSELSERDKGLTINEVKDECLRVISECLQAKEIHEQQVKEIDLANKRELAISTFAWNAIISKDDLVILRKNNSFVAIINKQKFAVGTGKVGKCYNIELSQLTEMIQEKGYTTYYKLSKDADFLFDTERLKALNWLKVCA